MQWIVWLVGGLTALFGLHRLALRLEARGYLYYLHKKPKGSSAGAFVAMQRFIEPTTQHIEQVRHVEHRVEDDEGTGRGEAPGRPKR